MDISRPTSSILDLRDETPNRDRKFGSDKEYLPFWVRFPDGTMKPAHTTAPAILATLVRAEDNPEDVHPRPSYWRNLWWALIDYHGR